MKTKPYDEHYRRRHRIVGHYLGITAWIRGLDCVVLDRSDVQTSLKTSDVRKDRVNQFVADIEAWFKFHNEYYKPNSRTLKSLFLSRVNLDSLPKGLMGVDQRIATAITANGALKIERFSSIRGSNPAPSETEMVSSLALMAGY
jgi:hypothetical protein